MWLEASSPTQTLPNQAGKRENTSGSSYRLVIFFKQDLVPSRPVTLELHPKQVCFGPRWYYYASDFLPGIDIDRADETFFPSFFTCSCPSRASLKSLNIRGRSLIHWTRGVPRFMLYWCWWLSDDYTTCGGIQSSGWMKNTWGRILSA